MPNKLIMLAAAAALTVGGAAFEAKATVGGGTKSLSVGAKSYSLIERASCNSQGLFCHAGSACNVTRYASVCPAPLLHQ